MKRGTVYFLFCFVRLWWLDLQDAEARTIQEDSGERMED